MPPPYYYEDVEVGFRFTSGSRTVTEADVLDFAGLTGDSNPLHVDAEYAAASLFGQRVAHGSLVLSFAVALLARR